MRSSLPSVDGIKAPMTSAGLQCICGAMLPKSLRKSNDAKAKTLLAMVLRAEPSQSAVPT